MNIWESHNCPTLLLMHPVAYILAYSTFLPPPSKKCTIVRIVRVIVRARAHTYTHTMVLNAIKTVILPALRGEWRKTCINVSLASGNQWQQMSDGCCAWRFISRHTITFSTGPPHNNNCVPTPLKPVSPVDSHYSSTVQACGDKAASNTRAVLPQHRGWVSPCLRLNLSVGSLSQLAGKKPNVCPQLDLRTNLAGTAHAAVANSVALQPRLSISGWQFL